MIEGLIKQHLSEFQANKILDVGPGYGNFSRVAAQTVGAKQITYIDNDNAILEWQVAECKKQNLVASALNISLDVADLSQIEGYYDLILCQEIFEHLHNAEEVLSVLVARLAPRGRIVITVPTKRSERWLKSINSSYMKDEPFGHVREFDENDLRLLIQQAGLKTLFFIPTQPHYFVSHTWLFGTRMKIEGSSGRVLTGGIRGYIWSHLTNFSRRFFMRTSPKWWSKLLPRNYFVVAEKRQ